MRVYDNGVYRDMTPEEVDEYNQSTADENPALLTDTERIAELESKLESFESAYQKGVDEA